MNKIDLERLEEVDEKLKEKLDFISKEIRKLENNLKRSAFKPLQIKTPIGDIGWGEIRHSEGKFLKRLYFVSWPTIQKERPLFECPAQIRIQAYEYLQEFVDKLVAHQKESDK